MIRSPQLRAATPTTVSTVLFDLDGTLTDPKEGITKSVQYALQALGRPVPPMEDLLWTIGPPLRWNFVKLLGSDALADEGVRLYRERFAQVGLFENAVIDGIPALLDRLLAQGRTLYVATSKPHVFAKRILDHFGLSDRFVAIYGSELDGTRADKRDLIAWILAKERFDAAHAVMIGDREHDVIGARSSGIATVGVRWGYGSDTELLDAGAAWLVDRPDEIGALLDAPGAFSPAKPAPDTAA